jgi:hypothetical protein
VEVGAYSAPPPSGVQAGEANTRGIELGAIRIPAVNLELPTLQLPNFLFLRRNPRMFMDNAVAHYDSRPPVPHGPLLNAPVAPAVVPELIRPGHVEPFSEAQPASDTVRQLEQQNQELKDELKRQRECIEKCLNDLHAMRQQMQGHPNPPIPPYNTAGYGFGAQQQELPVYAAQPHRHEVHPTGYVPPAAPAQNRARITGIRSVPGP